MTSIKQRSITALFVLGLAAVGPAAAAEPITLKIGDAYPKGHVIYDMMVKVFIPALEGSGKIKVQYFPAGQLGATEDSIEAVRGGIVDITEVSVGIVAGKMPATNLLSLPGQFSSGEQLTKVFMQMINGSLKQEYDKLGIKIIVASGTPPYQVFTKSKPVRVPGDVGGLKLRGGGGDADDFLRDIGVTVVNMPSSQMYESLQRGLVDGALYLQSTAPSRHLDEVTKYATEGAPLMTLLTLYFLDQKKWDSLPPDIQQIILSAGAKAAVFHGVEYDRRNVENRRIFTDAGGKISVLTPEEIAKWRESYRNAPEKLLVKLEGRGFPYVRQVYAELQKLLLAQPK